MESPQGSSFRDPGFPVVCHFQRYWADSSKSTVQPKMESCFQDRACSVSSFIWTFGKVISLLFNTLSRFVIAFLPRSKHLLISRLQSPSAVILEPKKIKSTTVSTFSPSICHELIALDAMILVFWMLSFKPAFFTLLFHPHQEALKFLFIFCH